MKFFLVNKRRDPRDTRLFIETKYDYAGNTKTLPPDSRTEVATEDEAQLALSRYQTVGVSLEYER